jgi:hypothetical protein
MRVPLGKSGDGFMGGEKAIARPKMNLVAYLHLPASVRLKMEIVYRYGGK